MSRPESVSDDLARLRGLARLLDSAIRLPGGYRIGLDGLIGLIPGIGDVIGAGAGAYIVVQAARMGATTSTLVRMIVNVLLEVVVGVVPVVGDLFDFAWKANDRNIELLEREPHRLTGTGAARQRLTKATLALLGAFLVLLGLLFVGLVTLVLKLSRSLVAG
jgi:hypothetical protein